jgi:hypothetical protein
MVVIFVQAVVAVQVPLVAQELAVAMLVLVALVSFTMILVQQQQRVTT